MNWMKLNKNRRFWIGMVVVPLLCALIGIKYCEGPSNQQNATSGDKGAVYQQQATTGDGGVINQNMEINNHYHIDDIKIFAISILSDPSTDDNDKVVANALIEKTKQAEANNLDRLEATEVQELTKETYLANDSISEDEAVYRAIALLTSLNSERKKRDRENQVWRDRSNKKIKRYQELISEIVANFDKHMEAYSQLGKVTSTQKFDYEVYVEKAPNVSINAPARKWLMYDGHTIELNIQKGVIINGEIPKEGFPWHDAQPTISMSCLNSSGEHYVKGFGIGWKILSKDDPVKIANELFEKFMKDFFLSVL